MQSFERRRTGLGSSICFFLDVQVRVTNADNQRSVLCRTAHYHCFGSNIRNNFIFRQTDSLKSGIPRYPRSTVENDMRLPVTTENGITGLLLRCGKFPGSGLNENAVSIGSVLGSQAMYYIGTGKCTLCRRFIRIFGTLLFGYLHTYKTFRYKIMIAVSVTQPAIGITRQFCAE